MDNFRFFIWIKADNRDEAIERLDSLIATVPFVSETDYEYEWDI